MMYDTVMIASLVALLLAIAFALGVATADRPSIRWARIATRICVAVVVLAMGAMFSATIAEIAVRIFLP